MSDQESGNEKPQVEDGEEEPQTSAEPEQAEARSSETPEEPESVPSEIVLQHELDQAKEQAHEYLEGWQRARAEFANYKKRATRDKAASRIRTEAETLTKHRGLI